MSAIHRIDDIWSMNAERFYRLAYRLPAYQGVLRMIAENQANEEHRRNGGPVTALPGGAALPGMEDLFEYATD